MPSVVSAVAVLLLLAGCLCFHRRWARSRERYRALVANLPGAVYRRAADADWSMEFASDGIEAITGHTARALTSGERPYASLVERGSREAIVWMVERSDRAFVAEYPLTHADGSERWVRDQGQIMRGRDGSVLRLDGTLTDITESRRLGTEREAIEQDLRLAQRREAVGQLAAGIAHEINTPIQFVGDSVGFLGESFDELQALIAAYRELVLDAADTPELRRRIDAAEDAADLPYLRERVPLALERTRDGVRRVATIVGAMKDFGRPSQTTREAADLNQALRSTLIVSQSEYKYVADVETELGELPPLVCNVGELNQVFLNLIVNAAHAIGDNAMPRGRIRVTSACENSAIVIAVADDGVGIPDAIRDRIFDPFFTTKDVGQGTGQGLSIARAIVVDKHGGALTVASEVGRGTTFTVRLPLPVAA
jgi:PAS domain S-box-containing protein